MSFCLKGIYGCKNASYDLLKYNQGHWLGEIRTFRREIKDELKDSPSLKPYILEIFDECYQDARLEASDRSQLPLDIFPLIPIGSLEQILDDWLPIQKNEG